MAVETASDLASFFDESEWAEAALYTGPEDDAVAVPCSVVIDRGQGRTHFDAGERSVSSSERLLHVQASEVTAKRNGRFAMLDSEGTPTGEVIQISGPPSLDETGAIWTAQLLIVAEA